MNSTLERIRFAVLWLVAAVALAATMTVFFYEPGVLEEGVAGEMEGEPVTVSGALTMAAMVGVPLAFAVASLFVPGRANAIVNLVGGVLLGGFGLVPVASHVAVGEYHVHLALAVFADVVAWLIAGLSIAALRRRPPAQGPPASERLEVPAGAIT